MNVNTQSLASVARQALAVLGIVFGVLTQAIGSLHLPVAVSSILTIGGAVILAVEHYVSDPSTGTATVPVATAKGTIPVPVAPVAVTAPQAAGGVGHIDPVTTVVQGPVTVSGFPAVVPQGNPAPPPPSNA
jgi:hypothetical protein